MTQTHYRADRIIAHAKPEKPEPLNIPWNVAFLLARMRYVAYLVTEGKTTAEIDKIIEQVEHTPTPEQRKLVEELLNTSLADAVGNPRSYVMAKAARDDQYAGTVVGDTLYPPRLPGLWKASVVNIKPSLEPKLRTLGRTFVIAENHDLYDSYRNFRRSLGRGKAATYLQLAYSLGAEIQFEWIQSSPLERDERKRIVEEQDEEHFDRIRAALLEIMKNGTRI